MPDFTPVITKTHKATIRLKDIVYEDFTQYQKPSLFLGTCFCDFKCEKENPDCHCQNTPAYKANIVECDIHELLEQYQHNPITRAVVLGGFEPMLQFNEVVNLIEIFRLETGDDIVIYTGYHEDEIEVPISRLKRYPNIVLKVGRYVPNQKAHYDSVLGVRLASDNQYGIRL